MILLHMQLVIALGVGRWGTADLTCGSLFSRLLSIGGFPYYILDIGLKIEWLPILNLDLKLLV